MQQICLCFPRYEKGIFFVEMISLHRHKGQVKKLFSAWRMGLLFRMGRPSTCLGAVLVWFAFTICLPQALYAQNPGKGGGPPPAPVEVVEVVEEEVLRRITLVGTAEPWLETVVAAEEEGLVTKTHVDEGERVKEGQTLCEQDVSQLRLNIKAAKAALAEGEVLQAQAQREWERQKRLYSINSVSEKAYEDSLFKADAAKKKVARLQADLAALEDRLKKRTILAPTTGYVVERHCLVGQWLGEGQSVVTVVALDPIRFIVPVPERYVASVNAGEKASVTFDALPNRAFEGVIAAVIPRADKATRTFPVRVEISNPDGAIKAGMLGRVELPVGTPQTALLVPKDALVLSGMDSSVYVVNDEKARLVPVERGGAYGEFIEVKGDLRAGLKVVIRGNERLRPGQPVRIVPRPIRGNTNEAR